MHGRAAGGECALDGDDRPGVERGIRGAVALPFEAGFVDQFGAEGLGIADLQLLVAAVGVIGRIREREVADAVVDDVVLHVLEARCKDILGAQGKIKARRDIGADLRVVREDLGRG